MHTRNFFFSPQGGRSSYIKNRTIRPHLYPRVSRAWNGLAGDVLVEPASVGPFKSLVNKLSLT
nr:unnamed protein product [Callosobruchus chinensis]CAH7765041.1 unnamed protein product [Callosobruchus chinensis]